MMHVMAMLHRDTSLFLLINCQLAHYIFLIQGKIAFVLLPLLMSALSVFIL